MPRRFRAALSPALTLALLASTAAAEPAGEKLTLWYDAPAGPNSGMTEALPLGNGRLGAFVYGSPAAERIVLNEISLWSGGENPTGAYNRPPRSDGRFTRDTFGSFEMLGELAITLPGHDTATEYRRSLDIATATASVSYRAAGVAYRREVFVSRPAGVVVVRLTADWPGALTGTLGLKDSRPGKTVVGADGRSLSFGGALDNDLKYTCQLNAVNAGGTVSAAADGLSFAGCDALTVLVAGGTDYAYEYAAGFRGAAPKDREAKRLTAAAEADFAAVRAAHVKDYQALFNRVTLDLGATPAARRALPADRRKAEAAKGGDPEFEALLFQYGRYLLISSSRPSADGQIGLPANLQGLWADGNRPPWFADYHANINIQMNYWGAEVGNLGECHLPLFDLVGSQLEPWRKATRADPEYKTASGKATRGWAIRTSHNIYGGLGWKWDKTANAWYCHHFWEHYAFGRGKDFLRAVAYPVMKETCQFWEDQLKTLPDGTLVVPNGWSPEHGPTEDGVAYGQEIVWDLFNNFVEASAALDVDPDDRARVAKMRDRLATPGVGSWGQLLEWREEKHIAAGPDKALDTPDDHHRHTSHLFAVYPGRQITLAGTPKLAEAAKVSLAARGDVGDVREWSYAWRTGLWARLGDGDRALSQVRQFFADRNSCPNLFGLHPPMQIDGNFGLSGTMPEMLVQSHAGEIHLLPALPKAWPAGAATGLRARGGFTVDLAWRDGRLTATTLRGPVGATATVRHGQKTTPVTISDERGIQISGL